MSNIKKVFSYKPFKIDFIKDYKFDIIKDFILKNSNLNKYWDVNINSKNLYTITCKVGKKDIISKFHIKTLHNFIKEVEQYYIENDFEIPYINYSSIENDKCLYIIRYLNAKSDRIFSIDVLDLFGIITNKYEYRFNKENNEYTFNKIYNN